MPLLLGDGSRFLASFPFFIPRGSSSHGSYPPLPPKSDLQNPLCNAKTAKNALGSTVS